MDKTKKTRAHTPGPWRIGDAMNSVFGPPNGKPSPQTIAHLGVIDHEANGRLIAAAPDLLEALKDALSAMGEGGMNVLTDDTGRDHDWVVVAEAAIAKAEGR